MRKLAPWLVVVASAAFRIVYFTQLAQTPFLRLDRWAQTDMHYYDAWARHISAGDWQSASVPLPMHRWHHEIAQQYFLEHPDARAAAQQRTGQRGGTPDADEAIWEEWMGAPRFYQDPLYPYLAALTYKVTGPDPRWVIAWQLAAGVVTNLLIWVLARRYFGDLTAAFAGALAVCCAPLMFYEALLLRDSLIVCAALLIAWLASRAADERGRRWTGALGVALGAACLLKSTFVLLAIAIPLGLLWNRWRAREPLAGRAAVVAAGLAVAAVPLVVRNLTVGAPALSMASSGPMTFVASNEINYRPDVGFGVDVPVLAGFLGQTPGGWTDAVKNVFTLQGTASYSSLLWNKFDRAWHWFEVPNNENFYYLRMEAPVLAWMPVTFWLLAPLSLVGLVIGVRRADQAWPLYLVIGVALASMVVFYVLGRFRAGLMAAAIPFAALALSELALSVRHGRGPARRRAWRRRAADRRLDRPAAPR